MRLWRMARRHAARKQCIATMSQSSMEQEMAIIFSASDPQYFPAAVICIHLFQVVLVICVYCSYYCREHKILVGRWTSNQAIPKWNLMSNQVSSTYFLHSILVYLFVTTQQSLTALIGWLYSWIVLDAVDNLMTSFAKRELPAQCIFILLTLKNCHQQMPVTSVRWNNPLGVDGWNVINAQLSSQVTQTDCLL